MKKQTNPKLLACGELRFAPQYRIETVLMCMHRGIINAITEYKMSRACRFILNEPWSAMENFDAFRYVETGCNLEKVKACYKFLGITLYPF